MGVLEFIAALCACQNHLIVVTTLWTRQERSFDSHIIDVDAQRAQKMQGTCLIK